VYYHCIVETKEKSAKDKSEKLYVLHNDSLDEIVSLVVRPYLNREQVFIDGRHLERDEIKSVKVKQSEKSLGVLVDEAYARHTGMGFLVPLSEPGMLSSTDVVQDITIDVMKSVGSILPSAGTSAAVTKTTNKRVFIVHGRDDLAKNEAARLVEQLGLEAIILHEQANAGGTIIEKIEAHTDVGFAIVLYTACDVGGLVGDSNNLKSRARQNVVFEHGYLTGRLSRQRVCALVKGDVELPNDISGLVYIPMDVAGAWRLQVAKELRVAGFPVDLNKV